MSGTPKNAPAMGRADLQKPDGSTQTDSALPFMLLLFIGSGCAALIYEIVWLQMLQLVIGLTSVSLGVLLGTFMGGMCLGSLLLPRFVSTRHHPLKVYAVLELGIGVTGILILWLVPGFAEYYSAHVGRGSWGIAARALLAVVCLLPPTLMMGATLPAVSRWVKATPEGVSWLGFFYGGNIAGAVAGSLLAGFCLLRVHDMAYATYVAALINLGVALLAFAIAAWKPRDPASASSFDNRSARENAERVPGANSIYITIALSGLAALGAEVAWTRLLGLMLGATVYTFSIILAVFLIGLGIGSSAGAFISRTRKSPAVALGICQLLLALAVAWAACMISRSLPYWPIDPQFSQSPWYVFQMDMAMCLWTVLPAAILWGASFPLALASVAAPGQDPGKLVGGVYAANTVGAIIGALGFSLLVIPTGGTLAAQRVLIFLSGISALVALVPQLLAKREQPANPGWTFAGGAVLAGSIAVIFWLASSVIVIPWSVVAYGRFAASYKDHLDPVMTTEDRALQGGSMPGKYDTYCTYMGEGLNGTICVSVKNDGVRSFHSAGKVQASSEPQDMRLQRMLGHISALAHPNPRSVLVVACGAGVTAGSFIPYESVTNIVICDIEPLVPANVAPMFKKENYNVVNDPRVRVVRDDGRHFIRTTKEKFDIITSDPIDPWVKGCAALNTAEYYQMCKAHLTSNGVVSLWMALYESDDTSVKSLIATFCKEFPDAIFWSNDYGGDGYDAVLFGQPGGTHIDLDQLQARLDRPDHARVRESLDEVGFHSGVELLATFAGRGPDLGPWLKDAQINTDRNMRLQYLAGWAFNNYIGREVLSGITHHYRFPDEVFTGSEEQKAALRKLLESRKH